MVYGRSGWLVEGGCLQNLQNFLNTRKKEKKVNKVERNCIHINFKNFFNL